METILQLMVTDHAKVAKLLAEFSEEKSKKTFNAFKDHLQKHFFVEEKAIFLYVDYPKITDYLLDDHNKMLKMLTKLEKDYDDKLIKELGRFIIKHKGFEEEKFYPDLDEDLEDNQKEKIIERIHSLE